MLAPIFGSGCLDSAMAASEEGANVLAAMFKAEQELIRVGALPSDNYRLRRATASGGRPARACRLRAARIAILPHGAARDQRRP